ncbi:hypothetical protein Pla123a_11210 [Posidoniimonas polymericola]|uniref:PEP-CTERM protein-sorting domain-containing protein n=1 Tax=Posidoniimonas polymericola TaxID=2528002 RepID=A0A5C5YU39_9BACT|nr:hypothetical protein [Posidoniimonas polymericola]TWT78330.1 hypothetical protein Pla123a_11210 [Posidoniimonas polymericola]
MSCTKVFLWAVAATFVASAATADILIDPDVNNGSFEYAGGVLNTTKIQVWDGTPDIDNWSVWTEMSTAEDDSGVQNTGNASDGTMIAFMQGGNAMYNMTSWVPSAGDEFYFSWDHVLRGDRAHTVSLVYDAGGVITSLTASETPSTGVVETIANTYIVPSGSPLIGNTVGLGVVSPGAYPEIDNFILTVNEVAPVDGDVDGDRDVDLDDYIIIRDNFRLSPATKGQGDLTGADVVDFQDFLFWKSNAPQSALDGLAALGGPVPEPASALLCLASAALLPRRRRA